MSRGLFDLGGKTALITGGNGGDQLTGGSGADLFAVFEEIASNYSDAEAADLYAGTAERTYRI